MTRGEAGGYREWALLELQKNGVKIRFEEALCTDETDNGGYKITSRSENKKIHHNEFDGIYLVSGEMPDAKKAGLENFTERPDVLMEFLADEKTNKNVEKMTNNNESTGTFVGGGVASLDSINEFIEKGFRGHVQHVFPKRESTMSRSDDVTEAFKLVTDKLHYQEIIGVPHDVRFSKDGRIEGFSIKKSDGTVRDVKVDLLALQKDEFSQVPEVKREIDRFIHDVSGGANVVSRNTFLLNGAQTNELYKISGYKFEINLDEDAVLLKSMQNVLKKIPEHQEIEKHANKLLQSELVGVQSVQQDDTHAYEPPPAYGSWNTAPSAAVNPTEVHWQQAITELSPTFAVFGGSVNAFFAQACIYKAAEMKVPGKVFWIRPPVLQHQRPETQEIFEMNKNEFLNSYNHLDGRASFSEDNSGKLQVHIRKNNEEIESRSAGDLVVSCVAKTPMTPFNEDLVNKGLLKKNPDDSARPFAPADDNIDGYYTLVGEEYSAHDYERFPPEMFKAYELNMAGIVSRSSIPWGWQDAFNFGANIAPKHLDHGRLERVLQSGNTAISIDGKEPHPKDLDELLSSAQLSENDRQMLEELNQSRKVQPIIGASGKARGLLPTVTEEAANIKPGHRMETSLSENPDKKKGIIGSVRRLTTSLVNRNTRNEPVSGEQTLRSILARSSPQRSPSPKGKGVDRTIHPGR